MDAIDVANYKRRLQEAFDIVNDEDATPERPTKWDKSFRYRSKLNGVTRTAHVSIVTLDRVPHFRIWVDHSNGASNYTITSPFRAGEEPINPGDPDQVLDQLTRMEEEANNAFADHPAIGPDNKKAVEIEDKRCLKILNALIHAYLEFLDGRRFVLQIRSNLPYGKARFFELIDDVPHEFLTPAMAERLQILVPWVSHLEYSRQDGMSYYDIRPLDPTSIVITAEDMPKPAEIRETLLPIADTPAPHLLDEFVPARI